MEFVFLTGQAPESDYLVCIGVIIGIYLLMCFPQERPVGFSWFNLFTTVSIGVGCQLFFAGILFLAFDKGIGREMALIYSFLGAVWFCGTLVVRGAERARIQGYCFSSRYAKASRIGAILLMVVVPFIPS